MENRATIHISWLGSLPYEAQRLSKEIHGP